MPGARQLSLADGEWSGYFGRDLLEPVVGEGKLHGASVVTQRTQAGTHSG